VAENTNNAGRQANRRVEIVVSGAAIQAPGVETSSVTQ
jgi:hypothetical protein